MIIYYNSTTRYTIYKILEDIGLLKNNQCRIGSIRSISNEDIGISFEKGLLNIEYLKLIICYKIMTCPDLNMYKIPHKISFKF